MANTNKVVELNGNYYDALSGAIVPAEGVQPQHVASLRKVEVVTRPSGHHTAKSMDGMAPRAVKPIARHQPARSSTLMRHAVKQPAAPPKAAVKAQAPMDTVMVKRLQKLPAVAPKLSASGVHVQRAERAQTALRSDVVRRFAQPQPVAAKPVTPASYPAVASKPIEQPVAASTDVFSQALAAAAEHQSGHASKPQAAKTKKRHGSRGKKLAFAGIAAALVLGIGAFVFLNKPILEMRMASMRSGIGASLPDYTPLGFDVSDMKYSAGAVKVAFNGPSGQNFSIDQKKSNWDSDTLMDNFVATTDKSYNAYQANGRTVFIYGKGNATWVNGGIWYQLQSNGLSDDEMLKVASTM